MDLQEFTVHVYILGFILYTCSCNVFCTSVVVMCCIDDIKPFSSCFLMSFRLLNLADIPGWMELSAFGSH